MSVDSNEVTTTTTVTPVAVPAAPTDLNSLLVAQLAPVAQQAAQSVVAQLSVDLESRLTALENQAQGAVTQLLPGLVARVEEDPLVQRVVVFAIVGAALLGALVILVAALNGNSTALRWIGAAPALIVSAALWVSQAGVTGKKAAPPA